MSRISKLTAWISVASLPVFAVTVVLERSRINRRAAQGDADPYLDVDAKTSVAMGAISTMVKASMIPVDHAISTRLYEHRVVTIKSKTVQFAVGMVAWDLAFYWWHRTHHRSRILWASHSQHHSSEEFNLSTALRQETPQVTELAFLPLVALVGVTPDVIALSATLNLLYQYWIHTELVDRMPPWFEGALNTPSHHRAHHGSNQQYLDKNYAGVSIVWDRLFNTFEPEDEPVTYGLTTNIDTYRVPAAITHEYRAIWRDARSASGWRAKLGQVFMSPGWAPASPTPAIVAGMIGTPQDTGGQPDETSSDGGGADSGGGLRF